MSKKKYTIAVDFDGVIHSYDSPWVSATVIPDPPVPGAIPWLVEIAEHFEVVIHTTRGETPEGKQAVRRWLIQQGLPASIANALPIQHTKPPALAYLDDRAMRFEGKFPTPAEVHAARPWNKRGEGR